MHGLQEEGRDDEAGNLAFPTVRDKVPRAWGTARDHDEWKLV